MTRSNNLGIARELTVPRILLRAEGAALTSGEVPYHEAPDRTYLLRGESSSLWRRGATLDERRTKKKALS